MTDNWLHKPQSSIRFEEFISSTRESWERFVNNGDQPPNILSSILSSWQRSIEYGVDPFQSYIPESLRDQELKMERERNEKMLNYSNSVMKQLFNVIEGSQSILAISDKSGYLLDVIGDQQTIKEAELINFFPGAPWSEEVAGTNAIGTVIKQKKPIEVVHTEHFCTGWHNWTCVSSPIMNPLTNELMGVIDLSGKWTEFPQHTLGMAMSMARNISYDIEREYFSRISELNPFLLTAFRSFDEGLMIIDQNKNIVKTNAATRKIIGKEIKILSEFPYFNSLLDKVLFGSETYIKEEIVINHHPIVVTIYPVDKERENIVGVIVRFHESKVVKKSSGKKDVSQNSKQTRYTMNDMIGSSPKINIVIQKAKKASSVDSTLLITGETGVGKELIAQAVHSESSRRNNPFIAVNCGAIPRNLIESDLFGYEPGSFTGASQKGKKGKFELAHTGTIFLDEIGDMPNEVQVHLLRVLEESKIQRIGGDQPTPIDVRVIAATNRDLLDAVKKGDFRADLLYRLKVIHLEIPSLKDRKEDIPFLVHHFMEQLKYKFGKNDIHIDQKVMEALQEYSWPGNIRELKNIVEQMLFNMEENQISLCDLPQDIVNIKQVNEREEFIEIVQMMKGNMNEIADKLGISRATLYRKMKKYGITKQQLK